MPLTSGFVPGPAVKVAGQELTAPLYGRVLDIRVELAAGVPGRCTLRLDDADFKTLDEGPFAVGAALVVSFLTSPSATKEVFNGEIVSLGVDQGAQDRHELVVGAYDKSHRLARATKVRTWQNKAYTDIVKQIAGESGLGDDVVVSPDPQHPYLVQTGTNADLLHLLADRTGCEWRVQEGTLVFKAREAPSSPPTATFGDNLIRFRATYSAADETSETTVRAWDPLKREAIVSTKSPTDVSMHSTTAPLATQGSADASGFGDSALMTGAVGVGSLSEADAVASAFASRAAATTFVARGEMLLNPDLVPGGGLQVGGVGTKLAGTYRLSTVEHIFGSGQSAITRFSVQGLEPATLAGLLGPRSAAPDSWGRVGFVVGTVSNNNDPDGLGRVRVKFPTLSDADESAWARMVGAGCGPQRGLMMMPELDDEVLVGFEHGDLRKPYVVGTLWSGTGKPPSTKFLNGDNVVEWMLRTQGGIELAFREGASGQEPHFSVTLANGGTKLYLGEDKVELWSQDKPLELKAGDASLVFDGKGNIELKGTKIVVKATGDLEASGANIKVKASAGLNLEGLTLNAKASASGVVQSSGTLELKGSLLKFN